MFEFSSCAELPLDVASRFEVCWRALTLLCDVVCQVLWVPVSLCFQFRGGEAPPTLALRVLLLPQTAQHWVAHCPVAHQNQNKTMRRRKWVEPQEKFCRNGNTPGRESGSYGMSTAAAWWENDQPRELVSDGYGRGSGRQRCSFSL